MISTIPFVALALSAVVASAAPLAPAARGYRGGSAGLEDYNTYHSRYMSIGCSGGHGSAFFEACCHPLSAGQSASGECSASQSWSAPVSKVAASGDVNGDAHATYFWQNGNPGACGNYNSDSTPLVAIPYKWWGGSDGQTSNRCGQNVQITRASDGRTVTAVVADLCPTCTTDNSLDLSWGAFSQLASASEGQVDITWKWL